MMSEIPYDDEMRELILSEIRPLKPGVVEDEVIERLERAARHQIAHKAELGLMPTQAIADADLERLNRAINSIDTWVRRMIDHALLDADVLRADVTLDDVQNAIEAVRSEPRYRQRSGRGPSLNLAGEHFLNNCYSIWLDSSQLPLPTSVHETTPFHVFCEAAIPDELRTRAGAGIMGMVRRVIDPNLVRRRKRWYPDRRNLSS